MLACKSRSAVGVFGGVVGSRNKLRQYPCKDTSWQEDSRKEEQKRTKKVTYSSLMKLPTERPPQLMPPIKLPPMKLPARDSRLGRLF